MHLENETKIFFSKSGFLLTIQFFRFTTIKKLTLSSFSKFKILDGYFQEHFYAYIFFLHICSIYRFHFSTDND